MENTVAGRRKRFSGFHRAESFGRALRQQRAAKVTRVKARAPGYSKLTVRTKNGYSAGESVCVEPKND